MYRLCSVVLALTQFAMPASFSAQVIHGVVTTGEPPSVLGGAEVRLTSLTGKDYGSVLTDGEGRYTIVEVEDGRHALWVRLIGYRPSLTVLMLTAKDTANVNIDLEPAVVEMEGITVYGIAVLNPEQREFWSRRDLPWNTSVDYTEIERLRPPNIRVLLEEFLPTKTKCRVPMVYIDGRKSKYPDWDLREIPLYWVYGLEVYRDFFDIPLRYRDATDPRSRCGAVLIWQTIPGQRR